MTLPHLPRGPENSSSSAPYWHYLVILVIPAVLWLINPNWLFQNLGHTDPWYYFGEFWHFPHFQSLLPTYAGERMTWIVPGYVLVRVFGQVRGISVLHCLVFLLSLYSLHDILRRLTDYRTAFLGALLLGCNPFFIGPNGWDYPEGLAIAFVLLSLAFAVRASTTPHRASIHIFLSGIAWFVVLYTYIAWSAFTPAYVYVVARSADRRHSLWRTAAWAGSLILSAGVVTTLALWGVYHSLGGQGFFFTQNVLAAVGLLHLGRNPWLDPNWYRQPTWLVFPVLAFCLGAVWSVASVLRKIELPKQGAAILWFYLYSFTVMVIMTIRPNRLLAFDVRTSILIPGVFLTLAITVFRVPAQTRLWLYYLVTALAVLTCLAPLARTGLYEIAFHRGFIVPATLLILVLACAKLLRWADTPTWAVAVGLFAAVSFGLIPASTGTAWRMDYKGPDISERTTEAMKIVSRRLPPDRYPIFWYNDVDDHFSAEYRGIMCAFLTINESMLQFPKVSKHFGSGARIIALTEQRDVMPAASYILGRKDMPVALRSQDLIDYGGTSYWITQMEVLPLRMENLRRGFQSVRDDSGDERSLDFGRSYIRRGNTAAFHKTITVPESGVYQFEVRYRTSGDSLIFGALSPGADGTKWIEQSGHALEEDGNQVRWFRLGAKAGTPVNLAIQLDCPANAPPVFPVSPKLAVLRDTTGASLEVFDFLLQRPDPEGNLVENGRFDGGLAGWEAAEGELRIGTDCYRGGCAKFIAYGGPDQYVSHWDVAVLHPGGFYSFGAWIKSVTSAPQPLSVGVWDAAATRWVAKRDMIATPQWTNVSFRFQNDSSHPIGATFLKTTRDPGTLLIDEVVLKPSVPPQ